MLHSTESRNDWYGSCCDMFKVMSQNLCGGSEENLGKPYDNLFLSRELNP
jgi:hypothetical protein